MIQNLLRSFRHDLKILYIVTRYEEEITAETLLNEFYNNLSDKDKLLYSEMADFAIELGYKSKQESISKI
ncbi:hypothetical protein A9239_14160 [Methanosarcina sp. A14]|nr:hypothetical protein A9239_14160 [Methanosarcina sp. A14]